MTQCQVSGRYRGADERYEVELRVDVDGPRPAMRISADYFDITGGRHDYAGSMCIDRPVVTGSAPRLTITGSGRSTWDDEPFDIRLAIGRDQAGSQAATLTHLDDRRADALGLRLCV